MATTSGEFFVNRPAPIESKLPWKDPPEPSNPPMNGLPLALGAIVASNVGFVQSFIWRNAGFGSLRYRPELDGTEPRYDPTVIRTSPGNTDGGKDILEELRREDWEGKKPISKSFPSVWEYHEAYKSGKVTPTDVAKVLLPLINRDLKERSKHSTAFLQVREDLVLEAAEASTKRYAEGKFLSPIDGVPVAVKDEVDVTGYRKCYGTKLDFTAKDDSTSFCVRKWLEAGAVLLGKTNMHEMGSDITNNNAHHGTPLNPNNEEYYTGGSSGGSAYTVAAGISPLCEGNDGGGSIRIPATYCGLYGLKPSHSRVSKSPGINLARSTAVSGPLAANMLDLELGYRIMAQPDPSDPDSSLFIPPTPISLTSPRPKLLGIFQPWFDRASPLVKTACQKTLDHLTSNLNYQIVPITLPLLPEGQTAHAMTILSELAIGIHPSDTHKLTAPNKVLTTVSRKTTNVDFLQAQRLRNLLMQHLFYLFQTHPGLIIVTPTTPNAGWKISPGDLAYGFTDGNKQIKNMEYVWLANFTGIPSLSVPCGYSPENIPIGLQGMAEWCGEDSLLAFGYDCEKVLAEERKRPGVWVDVLGLAARTAAV